MTKTELIKGLQEREQRATEADGRWAHQRYAGQAEAYRMVISVLARLDVPELRWKTGAPPHDTVLLFQWADGEYDIVWFYDDDHTGHNCRWLPLFEVLALIAPPEEPDGLTIPGWDLE
ncbi:MAG: hypothetical protein P8123_09110 [bacterium]